VELRNVVDVVDVHDICKVVYKPLLIINCPQASQSPSRVVGKGNDSFFLHQNKTNNQQPTTNQNKQTGHFTSSAVDTGRASIHSERLFYSSANIEQVDTTMKDKFGSSSLRDFAHLEELYRSSSGAVYRGVFKYDGHTYVIKEKRLSEMGRRRDIMNEVNLLTQLRHENIVQCEGWFRDIDRDTVCMVLEHCSGGDLDHYLQQRRRTGGSSSPQYFTEQEIWTYFAQVCAGVRALHEQGIVHRDLKTLNILLSADKRHLKVSDLGVSRQVSEQTQMLHTLYGTPLYLSPEVIENKPYNEKTDIWSLGIILYELCAFTQPFRATSLPALSKLVTQCEYDPLPAYCGRELTRCVKWLLQRDFVQRPTISQLCVFVDERLAAYAPIVRPNNGGGGRRRRPSPTTVERAAVVGVAAELSKGADTESDTASEDRNEQDMDEDSLDPSPGKPISGHQDRHCHHHDSSGDETASTDSCELLSSHQQHRSSKHNHKPLSTRAPRRRVNNAPNELPVSNIGKGNNQKAPEVVPVDPLRLHARHRQETYKIR
jgi:serine/threonine protein kinase